jgi:hypothetical protein
MNYHRIGETDLMPLAPIKRDVVDDDVAVML